MGYRVISVAKSICHVATSSDSGKRLDALLAGYSYYVSRSAAVRAIEDGRVLVNGNNVAKKHVVSQGEAIVCQLDEPHENIKIKAQPIDLDIRYEDKDIIVLSKQAGLVCHPSADRNDNTLVNALLFHYGAENLCNVQGENDRPGIVHRLDGDTSGLMLAAKNDIAGKALMEDISVHAVDRRYITLVHGIIPYDSGMIDAPIARSANDRTRMVVRDTASAREAVTTFRVLERFDQGYHDSGYSLVECKLFTGRTHQIRVHMLYTQHPVVGDPTYCLNSLNNPTSQLGLKRQFLHSYFLNFDHPITGENMTFADDIPTDLKNALKVIENRSFEKTEEYETIAEILQSAPKPALKRVEYAESQF